MFCTILFFDRELTNDPYINKVDDDDGPISRSFNFWILKLVYYFVIKRLRLSSQPLHIPATLWATMWAEFRSHCEGQV